MAFLVTGVAGINMSVCPVFFLIKPTHLFIAKTVTNLANWVSNFAQIAAKIDLKRSTT